MIHNHPSSSRKSSMILSNNNSSTKEFCWLPQEIIEYILVYLSMKKHHGQYSRIIDLKPYINIEWMLRGKKDIVFIEKKVNGIKYINIFNYVYSLQYDHMDETKTTLIRTLSYSDEFPTPYNNHINCRLDILLFTSS